ncbi:MAG: transposase [Chitinophagales bacterium]
MLKIPLEPNKYYHIYNHANGSENLFAKEENYYFFLKKYAYDINPIADTFAYCLMPNHIHFAIRIKPENELLKLLVFQKPTKTKNTSHKISQQFSNLFNSYSKAFNKQQNRSGSLFMQNFKRKHIHNDEYFRQIIHYIHFNPVHHGFVEDLREWKYSSFQTFFSTKATKLAREEVIEWFGNKDKFWNYHQNEINGKLTFELE